MEKPVFVLAFADYRTDRELHLRELGNEQDALLDILRNAENKGFCKIEVIANANARKIVEAFSRNKGKVVGFHFAGHAEGYRLMLADQTEGHADGFASFLGKQSQLKFVFLNACSTKGHVEALHHNGVPIVFATDTSIKDTIAVEVAKSFYDYLTKGWSLGSAFSEYQYIHDINRTDPSALRGINLDQDIGYPWDIYVMPGASSVLDWSLYDATGDYLFNLPLPTHYGIPGRPFKSLQRFERNDARIFFGRGKEIRDLYNKVIDRGINTVILFYGESGTGKSSMLEAGLLPRLENDYRIIYIRRDGKVPIAQLLANQWNDKDNKLPVLAILDQVEEVFTRPIADEPLEWKQLVDFLNEHVNTGSRIFSGKVILSYRKEFHSEVEKGLESSHIPYSKHYLGKLSREGIIEAVSGIEKDPALQAHFNVKIEHGLPEMIADDLLDDDVPAVAPVLQILLDKMWENTNWDQPQFTIDQYRKLKREGLLLKDFLQEQITQIGRWNVDVTRSGLMLDLLYFFTTPSGTSASHYLSDVLEHYGETETKPINELLKRLSDSYLLSGFSGEKNGQNASFRLAHDTLVPPIHTEYERSTLPGQMAERLLSNLNTSNWKENPERYYFNQEQVNMLITGKNGMRKWTKDEESLVAASQISLRNKKRNRRIVLGSFIGLGLALLVLLFSLYRSEIQKSKLAEARLLEEMADNAESNPSAQLELLKRSLQLEPENQLRKAKIFEIYSKNIFYRTLMQEAGVQKAAISSDGRYCALATAKSAAFKVSKYEFTKEGLKFLHDMQSSQGNELNQLVFSSNGDYLAGGGADRQIHIWKLNGDSLPNSRLGFIIDKLGISPSGELVAASFQNQTKIGIWKSAQKEVWFEEAVPGNTTAISFSPDGKLLAIGNSMGEILMFEIKQEGLLKLFQKSISGSPTTSIAFIPDSYNLMAGFENGEIRKFSFSGNDMTELTPALKIEEPGLNLIRIDRDAALLLAAVDKEGYVFRLSDQSLIYRLEGSESRILDMGFSAEKDRIFTILSNGEVREWNLPEVVPFKTLVEASRGYSVSIAKNGETDICAGTDGRNVIYSQLNQSDQLRSFERHQLNVTAIDLKVKYGISGGQEGLVYYWELDDPENASVLDAHQESINSAVINDEEILALTTSQDKKAILWDLTTRSPLNTWEHPRNIANGLFLSNDQCVTACEDGKIRVWSTSKSDPVSVFGFDTPRPISSISVDLKEQFVLTGTASDTLFLFSMAGDLVKTILVDSKVNCTAFDISTENFVAGTDDGRILVLTSNGDLFHQLFSERNQMEKIPDPIISIDALNHNIISGTFSGKTQIWKNTKEPLRLD